MVLLADPSASDKAKAPIAAQRAAGICGRILTPGGVPFLVDAADALGVSGQVILGLLGPYDLRHDAADAAERVLERHRSAATIQ